MTTAGSASLAYTKYRSKFPENPQIAASIRACLGFVQHLTVAIDGVSLHADACARYARIVRHLFELDLRLFDLLED
jgi:hypothetical protein